MANENLTTFTEVDTGGVLTVDSADKVSCAAMPRTGSDAYLYKSYGADYFNALNINFEGRLNSTSDQYCMMYMGLSVGTVDDASGWGTEDIQVAMRDEAGSGIYLYFTRGYGVDVTSEAGLSFDTTYYFTLSRTAGSATVVLKVYSESARTTLLYTLTLTSFNTGTKWRYLYAMANATDGPSGRRATGYYQNIDLAPAAAGPANLKSYNTNLKANIKTVNSNTIANCKTLNTNA